MTAHDKLVSALMDKSAIARWRVPKNLIEVTKRLAADSDARLSGKILPSGADINNSFFKYIKNTASTPPIESLEKKFYPETGLIKTLVSGALRTSKPSKSFYGVQPVPDFVRRLHGARSTTFHNREFKPAHGQPKSDPQTLWRIAKNDLDPKEYPNVFAGNRFSFAEAYAKRLGKTHDYAGLSSLPTSFGFLSKFKSSTPVKWRDFFPTLNNFDELHARPEAIHNMARAQEARMPVDQLSVLKKYIVPATYTDLRNVPIVDVSNVRPNSLSKATNSYRQRLTPEHFNK